MDLNASRFGLSTDLNCSCCERLGHKITCMRWEVGLWSPTSVATLLIRGNLHGISDMRRSDRVQSVIFELALAAGKG
jgi:hypothetical protein